jgi:hypothetical protein
MSKGDVHRPIWNGANTHPGMKMTSMTTRHPVLMSLLCLASCSDERMRELGYTSDPSTRSGDLAAAVPGPDECVPVFVSADQQQRMAADDLASVPPVDRPFMRYLSLAHALNAGGCPADIERTVFAISKQINALSRAPDVVPPTPVGPEPVLVRLDLRSYGWVRQLSLAGQTFPDVWEAMIGVNPFAVPVTGPAGDFVAAETGSRVAVLNSDSFIGLVSEPDVYYALLGVPATLGELRQSVGLPGELEPLEDGALRTAMHFSRILRPAGNLRVLDRYSIPAPSGGSYWEASHVDAGVFLADPLNVQADVQRLIAFTLPNGMLAFAATNALGERIGVPELVLDTNRDDFAATVPTSCNNCHAQGFIPATDDARAVILASPELFDDSVVAAYEASPTDAERAEVIQADSEVVLGALERAGGSGDGGDPISQRFFVFIRDVTLESAAADLLVTPDLLLARIRELDAGLLPLALDLSLSRERFGELFAGAFCSLHAADENPPASCP